MPIVDLLALFSDPQRLQELTLAQRMTASLVTTLLGMGITFLALVILQLAITCMTRFTATVSNKNKVQQTILDKEPKKNIDTDEELNQEIVAAITVSLAVVLKQSPENLVIRDIRKVKHTGSAWSNAGLNEHMYHNI